MQGHRISRMGKALRDGEADARGGAGDERDTRFSGHGARSDGS